MIGRIIKEMEVVKMEAATAKAESDSAGLQLFTVRSDLDLTKAVLRNIRKAEGEQEALASVSIEWGERVKVHASAPTNQQL